jgi:ArsR family transcriptional regulator
MHIEDSAPADEGPIGNPCPGEDAGVKALAQLLRLLCEETRLRILFTLAEGERDVTGLWGPMGLPQATVSHHLTFLRLAGLVSPRRAGKHIHYRLGPGAKLTSPGVLTVECPSFALRLELRQRLNRRDSRDR